MNINSQTRLHLTLQNYLFLGLILVLFGLLAWLSTRYHWQIDWTMDNRNSLSETTVQILEELRLPLTITAFAEKSGETREGIKGLIERYQRHKTNLELRFIDPLTSPSEVKEKGIKINGELIIEYQGRSEHLQTLSESELTAVLQRLARQGNRLITFLQGHGEPSPTGFSDQDINHWANQLEKAGFMVEKLNFGENASLLHKTNVLVIPSPQTKLLPAEVTAILDYINNGGNLLWLLNPSAQLQGLELLAEKLKLTVHPGMILDPVGQLFGVNNPSVVTISTEGYGEHSITVGFENYLTLLPQAVGLQIEPDEKWELISLLKTHPQAWSEVGAIQEGAVEYNEGTDINGPLDVGFALKRTLELTTASHVQSPKEETADQKLAAQESSEAKPSVKEGKEAENTMSETLDEHATEDHEKDHEEGNEEEHKHESNQGSAESSESGLEQRIVIIGDSDFLANSLFQYAGHSELAMRILNWLSSEDSFIEIPPKMATDSKLQLSDNLVILLGLFFLFVLPISLISMGILVWLHRRKA